VKGLAGGEPAEKGENMNLTEIRIEKQATERVVRFAVQTLAKLAYHENRESAQRKLAWNAMGDIGTAHGIDSKTLVGWWDSMHAEMGADADDADDRAAIDGND
jgi:hypothetical protein